MKTPRHILALVTTIFLVGCSSSNSRFWSSTAKNPVVVESKSAGDFLIGLHQQSLLPGDSKDMHGEIHSEIEPYPLPDTVTYPFSRTFHVSITGETFTNNYTVFLMVASRHRDW
jgi:hypothetical protein